MCPTEDHEACVWHHTFLEVKGLDSGRQLPASWHFRVDSLWPLVLLGSEQRGDDRPKWHLHESTRSVQQLPKFKGIEAISTTKTAILSPETRNTSSALNLGTLQQPIWISRSLHASSSVLTSFSPPLGRLSCHGALLSVRLCTLAALMTAGGSAYSGEG